MGVGQGSQIVSRFPTLPLGWYAVAESRELGPGQHLSRIYFGNKLRFYRRKSGDLRVTTPASLKKWLVREHNGLIFAWYHPDGTAPEWDIPVLPTNGWTDFRFRGMKVESHPQETSENSVDIGHFVQVHGFGDAWYERDLDIRRHLLKGAYGIDYMVFGKLSFVAKFEVEVHGLGYSLVRIHLPRFDMDIHTLILSTPIDEEHVHLRMGMSIKNWGAPVLPLLIREIASIRLAYEVAQDAPIWAAKRYVEKPLLAEGDGPIAEYRRYCKQFYAPLEGVVEQELAREQAQTSAA
ncbi:MAG: hypothetical protein OEM15_16900 [Myxococcales bacterium]|nr:hypothetical protein [Myxococcales bacterium]MDH3482763.1 hypothetical protein [Myxococcales bacterium]